MRVSLRFTTHRCPHCLGGPLPGPAGESACHTQAAGPLWGARHTSAQQSKDLGARGPQACRHHSRQRRNRTMLLVDRGFPIDVIFDTSVWGGEKRRRESRVSKRTVVSVSWFPVSSHQSPRFSISGKDLRPPNGCPWAPHLRPSLTQPRSCPYPEGAEGAGGPGDAEPTGHALQPLPRSAQCLAGVGGALGERHVEIWGCVGLCAWFIKNLRTRGCRW